MYVTEIRRYQQSEELHLTAVTSKRFDDSGLDEDNTYAKFSPSGSLTLMVANPALIGQFNPGDTFYLDFTPVEQ